MKGTEYCRAHLPQQFGSDTASTDDVVQRILQAIYEHGVDAINNGECQKAVDWLKLVERFDSQYQDVSKKISEAKAKLADKPKRQIPDWAYLGVLMAVICAFLSAFFQNTFTLIVSLYPTAASIVWLLHFAMAVAIVLWAKSRV